MLILPGTDIFEDTLSCPPPIKNAWYKVRTVFGKMIIVSWDIFHKMYLLHCDSMGDLDIECRQSSEDWRVIDEWMDLTDTEYQPYDYPAQSTTLLGTQFY